MKLPRLTLRLTQLSMTIGTIILTTPVIKASEMEMRITHVQDGRVVFIINVDNGSKSIARPGSLITFDDKLLSETNAQVGVYCFDQLSRTQELQSNKEKPIAEICSAPRDDKSGDISKIRPGGNNQLIPFIISPRYTLLLNNCPTLRWNAVKDEQVYTVTLYRYDIGEDREVWTKQVENPNSVEGIVEYPYPLCGEKPLEAGFNYKLVVTASANGSSSKDEEVNFEDYDPQSREVGELEFLLIEKDKAELVQETVDQISQGESTDYRKELAIAYLYAGNNLYAEAIERLEMFIQQGTQPPEVYRTLGELYAQSGLNLLAEKYYLRAIEQVEETSDIEKALAQQDLGELYKVMSQTEDQPDARIAQLNKAKDLLEQALQHYQREKDIKRIDQVTNLINQIKEQLDPS